MSLLLLALVWTIALQLASQNGQLQAVHSPIEPTQT